MTSATWPDLTHSGRPLSIASQPAGCYFPRPYEPDRKRAEGATLRVHGERSETVKIHEYQAKEILRGFGVAVPRGKLVQSAEEAVAAAREFVPKASVVKAQIHAGGRGKGGGVKLAKTPEEAGELFKKIHGMQLVTHQTGPQGQKVRKVYVEEGCDIARELYLGVTLDRASGRNTFMASSEGGVEIEEVAAKHPEKILRANVDPVVGLAGFQ